MKLYLQINDPFLSNALRELLPQAGICLKGNRNECEGVLSTTCAEADSLPSLNFFSLPQPLRFLDLLSLLENLPYSQALSFPHFSVDLREKVLKNFKTQQTHRLTGKECQLLRFFHHNRGQELSKDTLLREIWEYHPHAETHTLETHIYRLRQKLEENPTIPQVLLNSKDGYCMK
jgi:DNA-binding response OmpR family regulator